MPGKPAPKSAADSPYQLRIVQEVLLALLAAGPAHAYRLRARLALALGPLATSMNDGHVYVTLTRLEKAGLVKSILVPQEATPDRKVYELTDSGADRLTSWLDETSWPGPAPAEFHLKLVAAAAANLADPVDIVDRQRRELLTRVREAQRAALAEPHGSVAALLLEGVVMRFEADLRWLEDCAQFWNTRKARAIE
jgi:DNA-binding PadR family transcriptional regulator